MSCIASWIAGQLHMGHGSLVSRPQNMRSIKTQTLNTSNQFLTWSLGEQEKFHNIENGSIRTKIDIVMDYYMTPEGPRGRVIDVRNLYDGLEGV